MRYWIWMQPIVVVSLQLFDEGNVLALTCGALSLGIKSLQQSEWKEICQCTLSYRSGDRLCLSSPWLDPGATWTLDFLTFEMKNELWDIINLRDEVSCQQQIECLQLFLVHTPARLFPSWMEMGLRLGQRRWSSLDGVPARIGNWSLRQCRVKGVAITSLAELAFAFEDRKVCLHNPQFLLHKILVVKFAMHLPSMNVCSAHT